MLTPTVATLYSCVWRFWEMKTIVKPNKIKFKKHIHSSQPLCDCVCVCVCACVLCIIPPFAFHPSNPPSSFPPSPALRSPMSVPPGSYPAHFGVVSHAGLNGELASPGGFGGALTLSPQISAAASAYSRSPMVSEGQTPNMWMNVLCVTRWCCTSILSSKLPLVHFDNVGHHREAFVWFFFCFF